MAAPLTVNVMMLGGRRAGKTSALAAMQGCFDKEFKGTQLSITPINSAALDAIEAKRQEMEDYLAKASRNEPFVPGGEQTDREMTYRFNLKLKDRPDTIHLDFYDFPGEWLTAGDPNYDKVAERVKSSDVLIIIIDTPYLMEKDGQYNDVRNRCFRITQSIKAIEDLKTKILPKLVLFVPIKCEKYCHEKRMLDVYKRIVSDRCYGGLVEYLKGSCEMVITPIQTIGTAMFQGFDFNEATGDLRMGKDADGKEFPNKPLYYFTRRAEDAALRQGLDRKYAAEPKDCEQLAVYTFYYVLTYAATVARLKKEKNKKDFFGVMGAQIGEAALRLLKSLIPAPVREFLPDEALNKLMKDLRDRFDFASAEDYLKQRDLVFKKLKTSGDGYEIIYPDILNFKGEHK